jgi:Oxidoreductase family, NAD-binding Rossmann fold
VWFPHTLPHAAASLDPVFSAGHYQTAVLSPRHLFCWLTPFPMLHQAVANWKRVVEDPELDAVVIGTWPNMHRTLVCAALQAGKHVLCEARMVGRNGVEVWWGLGRGHGCPVGTVVVVPGGSMCTGAWPLPFRLPVRRNRVA